MAWNAGEYYMIDGDVVGPTTDQNNRGQTELAPLFRTR